MIDLVLNLIPPETTTWVAVMAMCGAVLVIGIAKSGFGGGIGILAVPLLALALNPEVAVGVLLPILIAADIVALIQHRRYRSWRHLRWAFVGGAIGVGIGTLLFWMFRSGDVLATALNLTVGGVCVVFVGLQVYRMMGGKVPAVPDNAAAGLTAGGVAGAVSTLAHSAGPVMTIYLLEHKLEKRVLVGTLVLFFFLLNLAKLPTYVGFGLINRETVLASAVMLPLVPVGSLMGLWMHRVIAERPFTLIMYGGAAAAGLRMIWKGLA
ncbi:MAG: sulfite exporter TauE/SafE family protein [Planctomycetota bacterium]